MKIYAQHPKTLRYLCSDGSWTEDHEKALPYLSAADAILDCQKRRVEFQIVLKFPESLYDLVLLDRSAEPSGHEMRKHHS